MAVVISFIFLQQDGQLCAQHCLNNLIQSSMFTAVELADIAQQLDDNERGLMQSATRGESSNYDDSGFFSVQVISKALECLSLSMISWSSSQTEATLVRNDPAGNAQAFICNHRQHWFTIRKFGNHWFNLNSLLPKPVYITATHLHMFLAQLQQEGYSIFIVLGELTPSLADNVFSSTEYDESFLRAVFANPKVDQQAGAEIDTNDEELRRAIELSKQENDYEDASLRQVLEMSRKQEEEDEIKRALALSKEADVSNDDSLVKKAVEMSKQQILMDTPSTSAGPCKKPPSDIVEHKNQEKNQTEMDAETLRMKRLEFLNRKT